MSEERDHMRTRLVEVLSGEEIKRIDLESRRILRESGVRVRHARALDLLNAIGCDVDRATSMVRMKEQIIDRAVEEAPGSFRLYSRGPSESILLGKEEVVFGPG